MTTYIITGEAGSGQSHLAARIAQSYPRYEFMSPDMNVYDGNFKLWTSHIDCVVMESLTRYDFRLNRLLKATIQSGKIPGIDEGCALVLVFQEQSVPFEFENLKNVFYVHVQTTDDTLTIE